ncbi:TetR family transcriptional regulator [Mycobacterium shigaense]|uniref:Putative transcriptional regulator, TetR n=1 Tax=Mycobacterium shigaense TaxID=722731 RepID=A0A1Z4EB88_9MYCO|nr:TetR family transcriptional regulator [Mycobacterium shigaense]PRI15268.1 TetR family transcriptional regulator [Mycobacterium shigaense]BAX90229.1 putative transcriptional regulator, TetR [Mycobacterium shigaense]
MTTRPAGRPRDTSIDERVLAVTRELLVEVGWDELSVRLVAARAGVGRSSLSRRWSSKADLVLHAILGESPDLSTFSGTNATDWINWVVDGSHELFSRPDVSAALPGLLLALRENDEGLRKTLWEEFAGPAVQLFRDDVNATTPDERRRADIDARASLAMAAGAAWLMTTIAVEDDTDMLLTRIAQILTAAVTERRSG